MQASIAVVDITLADYRKFEGAYGIVQQIFLATNCPGVQSEWVLLPYQAAALASLPHERKHVVDNPAGAGSAAAHLVESYSTGPACASGLVVLSFETAVLRAAMDASRRGNWVVPVHLGPVMKARGYLSLDQATANTRLSADADHSSGWAWAHIAPEADAVKAVRMALQTFGPMRLTSLRPKMASVDRRFQGDSVATNSRGMIPYLSRKGVAEGWLVEILTDGTNPWIRDVNTPITPVMQIGHFQGGALAYGVQPPVQGPFPQPATEPLVPTPVPQPVDQETMRSAAPQAVPQAPRPEWEPLPAAELPGPAVCADGGTGSPAAASAQAGPAKEASYETGEGVAKHHTERSEAMKQALQLQGLSFSPRCRNHYFDALEQCFSVTQEDAQVTLLEIAASALGAAYEVADMKKGWRYTEDGSVELTVRARMCRRPDGSPATSTSDIVGLLVSDFRKAAEAELLYVIIAGLHNDQDAIPANSRTDRWDLARTIYNDPSVSAQVDVDRLVRRLIAAERVAEDARGFLSPLDRAPTEVLPAPEELGAGGQLPDEAAASLV